MNKKGIGENTANPKRLAVNTLHLYFRSFLILLVNLYTSRIILEILGVEDYGIYNVVGGIVIMFSVISASLSNSITRYISYELGKKDFENLSLIFSTSINIQCLISLLIILLTETIGLWFMYTQMNIPDGRVNAAFWVLQWSVFTFTIQLISIPYNASIIAHEKMAAFAYIGILEVFLKLLSVYAILISPYDKLTSYSFFIAVSAILIRAIYGLYCKKHFEECNYKFVLNKKLTLELFGFAGWNFLGTSAYIFNTQGVNLLSNVFFGVIVNAARGIASQAEAGVRQFVNNFTTALNPQIIKLYAEKNFDSCFSIVRKGGKYSYFLMLYFFIPFVLESNYILQLWLKEVPEYATIFWQLAMLGTLVDLPGAPLTILAQATGEIKKFYIVMGALGCLVLPISYLLYKIGLPPESSYWCYVIVYSYLVFVRLFLLNRQIAFPIRLFINEVIRPIIIVTSVAFIIPAFIKYYFYPGLFRFSIILLVSFLSTSASIFILGMGENERLYVTGYLRKKFNL